MRITRHYNIKINNDEYQTQIAQNQHGNTHKHNNHATLMKCKSSLNVNFFFSALKLLTRGQNTLMSAMQRLDKLFQVITKSGGSLKGKGIHKKKSLL